VRLCVWSQAGRRDVHSKFSLHVLINGNFTLLAAFFSEYKTEYPLFAPQLPACCAWRNGVIGPSARFGGAARYLRTRLHQNHALTAKQ
jgi:hypothetical protein